MNRKQIVWSTLLGLLILFGAWGQMASHPGTDNLYVRQADAFLHGQLAIDDYGWDASVLNGKIYVAFPPAPALLLMPVVAVLGPAATDTVAVSLLLFILTLFVVWRILAQLDLPPDLRFWPLLAFGLGTPLWHALQWGDGVWFFAHTVAVFFLVLAIREALGQGRGWVAGIFLAGAMLSRQFTLVTALFLVVALWENPRRGDRPRDRWRNLAGFALPLLLAGAGYLWFNAARFGSPLDTGYNYLRVNDFLLLRFKDYGLFSPAYVLFNLTYLLFQGFHLSFDAPNQLSGLALDPFGSGLLAASPFVLAAFFARRDRLVWTAWTVVALTLLATLFYYNNGWVQLNGQRFTLDFWPVLLVPLALGLKRQFAAGQGRLWQGLIVYAVLLNAIALALMDPINDLFRAWPTWF
ncbi:MAG: hypothetical protein KBG20_19190 [Caldilineaceae bacterium]|nr:hypothetical protein [Caldilineaceae bacterium]MBP8109567.1 hypothetical protein [Caldilineaceae bacterium]MBP8124067.1 hypothetical protein [Caldilineaceae bacterium]MBP9074441.1 hypothetical protein [Caldilineaceae bacterium]